MITLELGNSYSYIKGATEAQADVINKEISFKSIEYGVGYVKQHNSSQLIQHNRSVSIKDAKGEVRGVTSFGRRYFKTVKEVLQTFNTRKPAIYRGWVARTTPLVSPRGEVPTGLVRRLVRLLERLKWGYTVEDTRVRPAITQEVWAAPKYPCTPYPEQSEAAIAATRHSRGVMVASTGVGKSLIIAQIIANLQLRTLIVVPSLELKHQLIQSLTEIFGSKVIGSLVVVQNVQALAPKEPAHFDCLILDEFHHGAAKTYQTLNRSAWGGVYYRFGVTATPFRNDSSELILLESLLDEIIYDIPYQTAVDKGYIVPLEAYYVDVPSTECDAETWAGVYKQLIVDNAVRNELVASLVTTLAVKGNSTLCIVKEIKHGQTLAELTGAAFAQGQDGFAGAFIKAFCERKLTALIGTQGVLGEGVDTKPCEYVIAAGLGKSRPALMQMFGRCFRRYGDKRSGKIILFRDASHRFSLTHFEEQCRVIEEEYGIKINKWDPNK